MGEIRFVGTGETRGYPYLVCKKIMSSKGTKMHLAGKSFPIRACLHFSSKIMKKSQEPLALIRLSGDYNTNMDNFPKNMYFSPIGQEYPFLQVSGIFLSRPAISA